MELDGGAEDPDLVASADCLEIGGELSLAFEVVPPVGQRLVPIAMIEIGDIEDVLQ